MKIAPWNVRPVAGHLPHLLIALGTLTVAIVLRAQYIGFASSDYRYIVSQWILHIRSHDVTEVYGTAFNNYTPLYSYLLGSFDFYFPGLYPLYTIKTVSFIGEGFAALWVYKIIALYYRDKAGSVMPALSVALFLLCPSVVTNASMTGQCDSWLAAFMLAALYYVMIRRNAAALAYGGLAFAFKPQAIFLAPFLLILMLRKDLAWKQLWIIPAVYIATCLPAWLEGRDAMDLLTIYWSQIGGHLVSQNAANPYFYLDGRGYDIAFIRKAGEIIATAVASALVWISYKSWQAPITPLCCMVLATLFATVMPFVLPLMHDRYFFMADIFSLLLACMQPRWFILTLLLQCASLIALPDSQMPRLGGLPGWIQSLGMFDAIVMNAAAIVILLWLCQRNIWTRTKLTDGHV